MVTLSGKVTDFRGNPLPAAEILIKDSKFADVYATVSGNSGRYRIEVEPANYFGIAVVKDYQTRYLEYWAWDVPLFEDMVIDARIDTLELYAINAFRPQGAYPSVFLYFRPMSLLRYKDSCKKGAPDKLDICPHLDNDNSINVQINGQEVVLLKVQRVKEYCAKNAEMDAYLVQASLPQGLHGAPMLRIDIDIKDFETKEEGAGCVFLTNP